jgi:hypothetical protein
LPIALLQQNGRGLGRAFLRKHPLPNQPAILRDAKREPFPGLQSGQIKQTFPLT